MDSSKAQKAEGMRILCYGPLLDWRHRYPAPGRNRAWKRSRLRTRNRKHLYVRLSKLIGGFKFYFPVVGIGSGGSKGAVAGADAGEEVNGGSVVCGAVNGA